MVHAKVDHEVDIPDLCKSIFLTKDKFLSIIWVVAALFIAATGGCIAWAMTTNSSITELKLVQTEDHEKIEYLQNAVNEKLDILIQRSQPKK